MGQAHLSVGGIEFGITSDRGGRGVLERRRPTRLQLMAQGRPPPSLCRSHAMALVAVGHDDIDDHAASDKLLCRSVFRFQTAGAAR